MPTDPPIDDDMLLTLSGASVMREDALILRDITFSVRAGQHVAILGRNGSGKSSLVKLITCELYPLAGASVTVFGRRRWNIFELRAAAWAGLVDRPGRTGRGVAGGFRRGPVGILRGAGLVAPSRRDRRDARAARDALERMGVAHLAGRRMASLSTGEARRVLIARALVHRPQALLLDEPCAGLDPVTRRLFLEDVRALARDGVTLLLITHHIEEIVPEIRHVVMMKGGRIEAQGAKEALLTNARLTDLFGMDTRVDRHRDEEGGDWYRAHVA